MRLGKSILGIIVTLFGISVFAFYLIRLAPGDPVLLLIGERGVDPLQYKMASQYLGLNESLLSQFISFISNAVHGELGTSIVSNLPVSQELLSRWPATVELGLSAMFIAAIVGIPAGIIASIYQNRLTDIFISTCALVGYSMPIFWWGMILILLFSIGLDITPVSGRINVLYDVVPKTGFMLFDTLLPQSLHENGIDAFISALRHLILPAFTMATVPIAVFARMTRASMLEVFGEDYMRTAEAKGLNSVKIVCIHAFRNALIPIVTTGGILFVTSVITGAILTESIFGWPGIGSYIVSSVYSRDYPVIQGAILLIGIFVLITNGLIEQLYRIVNPKLRMVGI